MKVIFILPATNFASEYSFRILRLIQNHLLLLSKNKEKLGNLNLEELAQYFIIKNEDCLSIFGHTIECCVICYMWCILLSKKVISGSIVKLFFTA